MKKQIFLKFLNTLLYSWGGDTPPEAIWAANEALEYHEEVTGLKFDRFSEEDYDHNLKLLECINLK